MFSNSSYSAYSFAYKMHFRLRYFSNHYLESQFGHFSDPTRQDCRVRIVVELSCFSLEKNLQHLLFGWSSKTRLQVDFTFSPPFSEPIATIITHQGHYLDDYEDSNDAFYLLLCQFVGCPPKAFSKRSVLLKLVQSFENPYFAEL